MKNIFLKRLSATNFRSKSFDFTFPDKCVLSGKNRCGKSTVKNAFFWLLTGYDDEDRVNYNLFDTTVEYTHDTTVPTKVYATLEIDGVEYQLERGAKMGWTRPRGQEEYIRKNTDDYSFSVNGISRTATEYKNWIEEVFAPIDMLKCMINTQHFLYLINDWKKQREYLANIAGEITSKDFTGDYEELYEAFKKYTPEQLRDKLKTVLLPLKKALGTESIKGEKVVELETLQNNIVNLNAISSAEQKLQELKKKRDELQDLISGMNTPDASLTEKRNAIYSVIDEKQRLVESKASEYKQCHNKELYKIQTRIREAEENNRIIRQQNESLRIEFAKKQDELSRKETRLAYLQEELTKLREENIAIKNRIFDSYYCAYCGAELPKNKIEELQNNFEQQKEKARKENVEAGKKVSNDLATLQIEAEKLRKEIEQGIEEKPLRDISCLYEELNKKEETYVPFEDTDEYKEMSKELQNLKDSIPVFSPADTTAQQNELNELNSLIEEVTYTVGLRSIHQTQMANIQKVKEEMKAMAQERASYEKIENQLNAYEQEKADIVGKRVNRFFEKCKVTMFAHKKDGSLTPNCVITMDGRKSTTLNKEGTITAGVDVSNAFCKFYDINMPLFIDDYESVSIDRQIEANRQIIALKVSNDNLKLSDYGTGTNC